MVINKARLVLKKALNPEWIDCDQFRNYLTHVSKLLYMVSLFLTYVIFFLD